MRKSDVCLLRCVDCHGDLTIKAAEMAEQKIVNGILICDKCEREFPVLREVGIFFRKQEFGNYLKDWEKSELLALGYSSALSHSSEDGLGQDKQLAASENWEYQWNHVFSWSTEQLDKNDLLGEETFWRFIPIDPDKMTGKIVFVGCGGRGREAYHLAKNSPKILIVNELGSEIYAIKELIKNFSPSLLLLRSDLNYHPLKPGVADYSICDHGLQHVFNQAHGFFKLVECAKAGGQVSVCVYSDENNFLMTHIVEPSKKFLHIFPLPLQRGISFPPALVIFLLIRLLYLPASKVLPRYAKLLPLFDHMIFWSENSLSLIWLSCFDLIHAPISYHFTKAEMMNLAEKNNLEVEKLVNTHGTTWSLVGNKLSGSLEIKATSV